MTDRFHLCAVCFTAWAPGGEHFCGDCKRDQPVRKPIPFPGLPSLPTDPGAAE